MGTASNNRKPENCQLTAKEVDAKFVLPSHKELDSFLENESDRGAILILTAYIEEALGLVISNVCVSNNASTILLKHGQPAGTFESRLVIAEAFGLIHEQEVKGLRILQKIRNKAAHFDRSGRGFDVLFDSASTADQLMALAGLFGYDEPKRDRIWFRELITNIVHNLALTFQIRSTLLGHFQPAKSIRELASELLEKHKEQFSDEDLIQLRKNLKGEFPYNIISYIFGLSLKAPEKGSSIKRMNETSNKN